MNKTLGIHIIGSICISLTVGVLLGYIARDFRSEEPVESSVRNSQGYTYINPLLECETNTKSGKQKYIPFEANTITRIKTEIQAKNPNIHLSVYFRNLNNGPWFGINEDEAFSPASLMKLPILMMYMKWSEVDPTLLAKKIQVQKDPDQVPQNIKPEKTLIIGQEYSIEEMLRYLIVYSDNTALGSLLAMVPETFYNQVFLDLGVPLPKGGDYTLNVKEYASFYRILYNASYLSNDVSEKMLKLLSETNYNNGLRSTIPHNIRIAHKFGERDFIQNGIRQRQLHDCGIIYAPNYPYLLCIMTKGENADLNYLSDIIGRTSSIIYEEIENRFRKNN